MLKRTLVYYSTSYNPVFNLALEEYAVKNLDRETVILILWQNRNTIVMGRHQNPYNECDVTALKANAVTLVRRLSGGGTVYHDIDNLNFSFIANTEDFDVARQLGIIQESLSQLGIHCRINERNDLIVDGKKTSGSAYYTKDHHKQCHHGTLLVDVNLHDLNRYLNPDNSSIQSRGIESVRSSVANLKEHNTKITIASLQKSIVSQFNAVFQVESTVMTVSEKNMETLLKPLMSRYVSWEWNIAKSPGFEIINERIFEWGHIKFWMKVDNGILIDCSFESNDGEYFPFEETASFLKGLQIKATEFKIHIDRHIKRIQVRESLNAWFEQCLL